MTSDNGMIPGQGPNSISSASSNLYFTGNEPPQEVELYIRQLDRTIRLDPRRKPVVVIGRSKDCDISLPHPLVSYRHAYLQLIGGHVHCVDLASRTGVYWGPDERKSGWLLPGTSVTIGPYTLTHVPGASGGKPDGEIARLDPLKPQSRERFRGKAVELRFLNSRGDVNGSRSWIVTQPITLLGSSPRCRLRIDHPSVSRVHCNLTVTPTGLWITDLMGKNGTWINGEQIDFRLLHQADKIRVGKFLFSVNYDCEQEDDDDGDASPFDRAAAAHGLPPAPAGGGYSEGFILSLIDRFTSMQQQMSAMSQQQMMFMAELVGTMHKNHHEIVQQELLRINQIGDQISQLQSQLSESQNYGEDLARGALASPPEAIEGPAESQLPARRPAEPPGDAASEQADAEREAASRCSLTPFGPPNSALPDTPRYTQGDVENHTHLMERMATLEKERNSRWKKILQVLTGSGP